MNIEEGNNIISTYIGEASDYTKLENLLPVIEKIRTIGYTIQLTYSDNSTCRIWRRVNSIPSILVIEESAWEAVVEFIKKLNKI